MTNEQFMNSDLVKINKHAEQLVKDNTQESFDEFSRLWEGREHDCQLCALCRLSDICTDDDCPTTARKAISMWRKRLTL